MSNENNWYCSGNLNLNAVNSNTNNSNNTTTTNNNENGLNHHHHGSLANINGLNASNSNAEVNYTGLHANTVNTNAHGSSSFCLTRSSHLSNEISASANQSASLVNGNSTFTELQPAATIFTQLPSIDTLSSGNKRKPFNYEFWMGYFLFLNFFQILSRS